MNIYDLGFILDQKWILSWMTGDPEENINVDMIDNKERI